MSTKQLFPHIGIVLFCVASSFVFLLFFSQTLSPLYTIEKYDSTVFKLMGQLILHGKIPYVDMFDHKGPMLYLIQALGQWLIPGRLGLFLLAVGGLSISIYFWYKSARLFTTPLKSILTIFLSLITYYLYTEYGNLTEDWNIPFISIAYYILLSSLINQQLTNYLKNGCIVGLCLACSFFIRPNDAVAFIGAPICGTILWLLKEKNYKEILKLVEGILIGFTIITTFFIVWFASHGAFSAFLYGLIDFNAKYSTGIMEMIKAGTKMAKIGYIPILVTTLILSYKLSSQKLFYILLPTVIVGYVLLGNKAYLHYWITWIPTIFLSFWILIAIVPNRIFKICAICVFLSMPIFRYYNWLKLPLSAYNCVKNNMDYDDGLENTQAMFESLSLADHDSIWAYNCTWHGGDDAPNTLNIFLYNNIIPCNRVPLILMAKVDTTLLYDMDITCARPLYILYSLDNVKPQTYSKRDSIFMLSNYSIVSSYDNPTCYLLKRK